MNEGGQSSTGQLLDFMVETHPAFAKLKELASERQKHHFEVLLDILSVMMEEQKAPFPSFLTRNLFLYPDLHGNRSPIADPTLRGVLIGLALDRTVNDLALKYLATCEAIACVAARL
jgi:ribulose kinase